MDRSKKLKQIASKRQNGLVLVLEDIHDPHNVAAIMRSADAFGVQEIYLIFDKQQPWNPYEIGKKTSGNSNKWLTFHIFDSSASCLEVLQAQGYWLCATSLDKEAEDFYQTDFQIELSVALIVGNERVGVSKLMEQTADKKIYIPMVGFCQSLNVSVTTAICLGEIVRQRRAKKFLVGTEKADKILSRFNVQHEIYREQKKLRKKIKFSD